MYSEPRETSKMGLFAKKVTVFNRWLFLQNISYHSFTGLLKCLDKNKQNPCVLAFISQKIRAAISANLFLNSILSSHYSLAMRH